MKNVQVACLVLEVSDKDKCKASREEIFLIQAANRSGVPEGDARLLFMHDQLPFDPELVIGHGMVTGAEAAELARRFKCRYLQLFYDPPEICKTHAQCDSASLTRAEKEMELGNSADFIAALGPQIAEEWSNILKRDDVIEIIPGVSDCNPRNSVATPHRRCLVIKTDRDEDDKINFATKAFIDCKKREKQVRITVQGTPRAKKADFQQELERKLSRSNFDVHVTSFDASIESIEGEVRVASLVLMPEPSESFGLRCLEAFSSGIPALVNNSFGIAHLLLNYFDEKFWTFVCPMEDDNDNEVWSDRIDHMLDEREQYFGLAADLRKEWGKKFTWDSVANKILIQLARSGCFDKLPENETKLGNSPSALLCSAEARKFVVEEMKVNDKRRKLILAVSPVDGSKAPSISHLSRIPWIAVFDFDVNSAETGYLASCGSLGNEVGMKICRIIPPVPEESKQVTLLNGVPWFLLEGTPESNRSVSDSLEWLRNIFVALENAYHVPITMVILWDTKEKNSKILGKKLIKLLHTLETSSLKKQIKLAVVATSGSNDDKPSYLEDIEEDWTMTIRFLSLVDFCSAINEITMDSPLLDEGLDFALPTANPYGTECTTGILPHDMRWINAELEVLYQSVGNKPIYEGNDALHFYRGGTISWYALNLGHAIERKNWEPIKDKIDELLRSAGTLRFKLPHQRGAGGTTSARKILFDFHTKYPCVTVKSISHTETAPAIKVLADFCKLPVIVLIDCKHVQGEEFDLDMLYNTLSNYRVPSIILEVVHNNWKYGKGGGKELLCAAETLNQSEREHFVQVYSDQRKDKLSRLRQLKANESEELQIPFYYALVTFEERFIGLEPFVKDCLANSDKQQRQVLVFLAMAHHYGHIPVSEAILTSYFNAPYGTLLEEVLTEASLHLLIEENGNWRPRHDLIGSKMLQSLLSFQDSELQARIHPDNWVQNIHKEAINFICHMPEKLVSCLLLNRGFTEEKYPDYFSPLINEIPEEDDAIKVFEKAIDSFPDPDNMFFKVHLGRFYSIKKKAAGFEMAIKYTDEGIDCADYGEMSRVVRGQFAQMKGVVYSRQVGYLIRQGADIKEIIDIAEMGVKWFRRAVSICPDMVDGYIPEVSMMCKLFEYVDRVTGSIHDFLLSGGCHPFIVDGISQASDTLENVPDNDSYTYWKARLLCLGLRNRKPAMMETLKLLEQLRESGRASRGPVNRKIADIKMTLCKQNNQSLSAIASEVIELLNEALTHDKPNEEATMRMWVRVAPFVPVDLLDAEKLIFKWCAEERSVRSYLFKYIIACIHVLEKGARDRYYRDIMVNANHDLNIAIKAINRGDVGRVRHPDRPVIWLGPPSRDMSQLVYLNLSDGVFKQRRLKNVLPQEQTQKLRQLTGTITRTDPKLGNISVGGILNVNFRTDLCDPPLTSANFNNRKVKFFLGFNYFGVDAFNVELSD